MTKKIIGVIAALLIAATAGAISYTSVPYSFTAGTKAESAQVNANFQAIQTGTNAAIGAINTAAGTKSSLNARLSVSMNADGTFKSMSGVTAGSQWTNPGITQRYSSATQFIIEGADHTDIYITYRRLKAILAASTVYSEVSSSEYTGGNTVVTIADAVLTSPITTIEHATISPAGAADSAISDKSATGYASATANTANTLVRRSAFGNFSAGEITATKFNGPISTIPYEPNVVITRGVIDADGTILAGSGFTAAYNSSATPQYTITPTHLYTYPATIIVSINNSSLSTERHCQGIHAVGDAAEFKVLCFRAGPTKDPYAFNFMIIGQ